MLDHETVNFEEEKEGGGGVWTEKLNGSRGTCTRLRRAGTRELCTLTRCFAAVSGIGDCVGCVLGHIRRRSRWVLLRFSLAGLGTFWSEFRTFCRGMVSEGQLWDRERIEGGSVPETSHMKR